MCRLDVMFTLMLARSCWVETICMGGLRCMAFRMALKAYTSCIAYAG